MTKVYSPLDIRWSSPQTTHRHSQNIERGVQAGEDPLFFFCMFVLWLSVFWRWLGVGVKTQHFKKHTAGIARCVPYILLPYVLNATVLSVPAKMVCPDSLDSLDSFDSTNNFSCVNNYLFGPFHLFCLLLASIFPTIYNIF